MPTLDGTTIGIILAGIVSLVTALGTVQTKRDGTRKREIVGLGVELQKQRRMNVAAVRYIYQCQLVLAARGVAESALPALPVELEELFRGDEPTPPPPGGTAELDDDYAGTGRRHRRDDA